MSLSDILEILAMSRLIAICTGSPAEGKKFFSREKRDGHSKATQGAVQVVTQPHSLSLKLQRPRGSDTVLDH